MMGELSDLEMVMKLSPSFGFHLPLSRRSLLYVALGFPWVAPQLLQAGITLGTHYTVIFLFYIFPPLPLSLLYVLKSLGLPGLFRNYCLWGRNNPRDSFSYISVILRIVI